MSDEIESKSAKASDTQSSVGVPVAIVIAGALVAAAIYFGGGTSSGDATEPIRNDNKGGGGVAAEPQDQGEIAGVAVGDIRPVDASDHVRGSAGAKVTIIEYSDIECPFCSRFHGTMQQLVAEYPNDVAWVYRHFPLEQLHDNAKIAAVATECAAEQGKFWEVLDYMFGSVNDPTEFEEENLPALVQKAGLTNMASFTTCLSSGKHEQRVERDIQDAATAGGRGTPYSVIVGPNGEKEALSGAQPYQAVKAAVDKYL